MANNDLERRRYPRVELIKEGKYRLITEDGAPNLSYSSTKSINISIGGLCLELPSEIKNGKVIRLEVPIETSELKHNIKAFCEVQWCKKNNTSKESYSAGISFIAVKDDDLQLINDYVSKNLRD